VTVSLHAETPARYILTSSISTCTLAPNPTTFEVCWVQPIGGPKIHRYALVADAEPWTAFSTIFRLCSWILGEMKGREIRERERVKRE